MRFLVDILVETLEDVDDDELMHVALLTTHLVVISDALQSDSTTHLLLDHLIDVELYQILAAGLVKVHKLFLHCS